MHLCPVRAMYTHIINDNGLFYQLCESKLRRKSASEVVSEPAVNYASMVLVSE